MTALMVLFLLVMSVALLAVTKKVTEEEMRRVERIKEITQLLLRIAKAADKYPGISVDIERNVIDFGPRARFETASYDLSAETAKLLRAFVPEVLTIARDPLGYKWLKRIVVEGYTDQRGSYLYNLNLSLDRAQNVLCALFAAPLRDEHPMSGPELEQIRALFLVGGYSYNSAKESLDASRRIELRLEFFGPDEIHAQAPEIPPGDFGRCALR